MFPFLADSPAVEPPKLDVPAATRALETQQVYRAPGAVAYLDENAVRAALGPGMKVLISPFLGHNYPNDDDETTQLYEPLSDWATSTHTTLIEVEGLYVHSFNGGAFGPSDIPELRQTTAHYDVTSAVLGMIQHEKTGVSHVDSLPGDPVVAPTPEQVSALAARLRANPVYNAPGRTDPVSVPVDQLAQSMGIHARIAAFPVLGPGQPMTDYAPALAKEFPGETVFVSYGMWLDVAGPNQDILDSARNYAYGRFEIGTFQEGLDVSDRIGTVAQRVQDLLQRKPFARPEPPAFDVRHRIAGLAPWVLLGSALVLAGGALLAWYRRRRATEAAERKALQRETALATASMAGLDARMLATSRTSDRVAAAAERQSTANDLFTRADTADAMREVRRIADEGLTLLGGTR